MQLTQIFPIIIVLGAVVMAFFTGSVIWQGKEECTQGKPAKRGGPKPKPKCKTVQRSTAMRWGLLGGALGMALCGMFLDTLVGGGQQQQWQQ